MSDGDERTATVHDEHNRIIAELEKQCAEKDREVERITDYLEMAMTIICNAGGGDWTKESKDWQEAARKWVDQYGDLIAKKLPPIATERERLHKHLRIAREALKRIEAGEPNQPAYMFASFCLNISREALEQIGEADGWSGPVGTVKDFERIIDKDGNELPIKSKFKVGE